MFDVSQSRYKALYTCCSVAVRVKLFLQLLPITIDMFDRCQVKIVELDATCVTAEQFEVSINTDVVVVNMLRRPFIFSALYMLKHNC